MSLDDSETCQRCHQPLLLDPTLASLTPSQHALVTSTLPTPSPPSNLPTSSKLSALPASAQPSAKIWSHSLSNSSPSSSFHPVGESYIVLSDPTPSNDANLAPSTSSSSNVPIQSLSNQSPLLAHKLHDILSARTPIDHPLCSDCTNLLQAELQKQLEDLSKERDAFIAFERGIMRAREARAKRNVNVRVKTQDKDKEKTDDSRSGGRHHVGDGGVGLEKYDIEGDDEEWAALIKRKADLEMEEERLRKILEEKEKELELAKEEDARVKAEEAKLTAVENELMLSHAKLHSDLTHLKNTLSSARTQLLLSTSLLSHLESTNVYNDAFQIGHVVLGDPGVSVGTINGLRLGGRPVVDWDEINAAWGLVALCIDRLAVRFGMKFETYRVVPLGSFSRIEELPPSKGVYELYASSDISPTRLLHNRRFNHALVGVLDLLRQLLEWGRLHSRSWVVDVEITKDRINGHPIRLPGLASALPSMSIMGLGSDDSRSNTDHHQPHLNRETSFSQGLTGHVVTGIGNSGGSAIGTGKGSSHKDRGHSEGSADEQWTRACRTVLAVLKRILAVESETERAFVQSKLESQRK